MAEIYGDRLGLTECREDGRAKIRARNAFERFSDPRSTSENCWSHQSQIGFRSTAVFFSGDLGWLFPVDGKAKPSHARLSLFYGLELCRRNPRASWARREPFLLHFTSQFLAFSENGALFSFFSETEEREPFTSSLIHPSSVETFRKGPCTLCFSCKGFEVSDRSYG